MMKKQLALLLAFLLLFVGTLTLASCQAEEDPDAKEETTDNETEGTSDEENEEPSEEEENADPSEEEEEKTSPEGNDPEGNDPEGNNPEGNDPEGNDPEGSNPEGNDPEGSNPEGNDPEGNDPEEDDGLLSYEEYLALSAEGKQAYMNTFASVDDFVAWYNSAKAEYDSNQGGSGDGPDIEIEVG